MTKAKAKILLFAGTTEGRQLAEACQGQPLDVTVCVATDYGQLLLEQLPEGENIHILTGRKDRRQMVELMTELRPQLVLDATHPYAAEATETIRAACGDSGCDYVRLLRGESDQDLSGCILVEDTAAAVDCLNRLEGKALLTVGSKELAAYTQVRDYGKRLFPRILPMAGAVDQAIALGFAPQNIIAMQGPFSQELNRALLKARGATILVTKESGSAGGFPEKLAAARDCGAQVLLIRRPSQEQGLSLEGCLQLLEQRFALKRRRHITLLGVGVGALSQLTLAGEEACRKAQLFVGAGRLLESLEAFGKPGLQAIVPQAIVSAIKQSAAQRVVVALSGDSGFYSGAKKLLPLLQDEEVELLPGISSIVYFCSRIGESWDDALLLSAHGRDCNLLGALRRNPKVLALTGGQWTVKALAQLLCDHGLGELPLTVGERLSYPDERISRGTAAQMAGEDFDSLAVLLVKGSAGGPVTQGWRDERFLRAKVPMTKQEVRAVTLAKLELGADSLCYDVGAGTGSVSLEMAECAWQGKVYAIEQKPEACQLIRDNLRHLAIQNVVVVEGLAPEALASLPAPTHAFIGGSSGNLREIVACLLEKNPSLRLVINTVTAESFAEALDCLKNAPVQDLDITQISAARGQKLGRYHLMTAQNPVYILSCQGGAPHDKS